LSDVVAAARLSPYAVSIYTLGSCTVYACSMMASMELPWKKGLVATIR
jgi:hypothetical protein